MPTSVLDPLLASIELIGVVTARYGAVTACFDIGIEQYGLETLFANRQELVLFFEQIQWPYWHPWELYWSSEPMMFTAFPARLA